MTEHIGDAVQLVTSGPSASIRDLQGNAAEVFQSGLNGLTARAAAIACSPEQIARSIAVAGEQYEKGQAHCESPIERMMLAAMIVAKWPDFLSIPPIVHDPRKDKALPDGDLVIVPQMSFGRTRLDFGLVIEWHGARHLIDIECDGIDYHDRRRDLGREIYLASWGVPTFRLYGTDIYRNAHAEMEPIIWRVCEWRDAKLNDLRAVARKLIED